MKTSQTETRIPSGCKAFAAPVKDRMLKREDVMREAVTKRRPNSLARKLLPLLLLSSIFHLPSSSLATIVVGQLQNINLQPINTALTFTPTNDPLVGASFFTGPAVTIYTTNPVVGSFSNVFAPGPYMVSTPLIPGRRAFEIRIQDSASILQFTNTFLYPRYFVDGASLQSQIFAGLTGTATLSDGSGYLANGNFFWNADGSFGILGGNFLAGPAGVTKVAGLTNTGPTILLAPGSAIADWMLGLKNGAIVTNAIASGATNPLPAEIGAQISTNVTQILPLSAPGGTGNFDAGSLTNVASSLLALNYARPKRYMTPPLYINSYMWGRDITEAKMTNLLNGAILYGRQYGWPDFIDYDDGWQTNITMIAGNIAMLDTNKFPWHGTVNGMRWLSDYGHSNNIDTILYIETRTNTDSLFPGTGTNLVGNALNMVTNFNIDGVVIRGESDSTLGTLGYFANFTFVSALESNKPGMFVQLLQPPDYQTGQRVNNYPNFYSQYKAHAGTAFADRIDARYVCQFIDCLASNKYFIAPGSYLVPGVPGGSAYPENDATGAMTNLWRSVFTINAMFSCGLAGYNSDMFTGARFTFWCNPDLISVVKDPLVMAPKLVKRNIAATSTNDIWVKNLVDGSKAVAVFNFATNQTPTVTFRLDQFSLLTNSIYVLSNLWTHSVDQYASNNTVSVVMAAGSVNFWKIYPLPPQSFTGSFTGNGAGVTNLNLDNALGTAPQATTAFGLDNISIPAIGGEINFSNANGIAFTTARGNITGAFTGNGANLTNTPMYDYVVLTNPIATPSVSLQEGDSLSTGYGGVTNYMQWLTNSYGISFSTNIQQAVNGQQTVTLWANYATEIAPYIPGTGTNCVVFLWTGINDIANGTSADVTWNAITNICAAIKTNANCSICLVTCTKTISFNTDAIKLNVRKLNTWIRNSPLVWDYLADVAEAVPEPFMAPSWYVDGVHFTSDGQKYIAYIFQQALLRPRHMQSVKPPDTYGFETLKLNTTSYLVQRSLASEVVITGTYPGLVLDDGTSAVGFLPTAGAVGFYGSLSGGTFTSPFLTYDGGGTAFNNYSVTHALIVTNMLGSVTVRSNSLAPTAITFPATTVRWTNNAANTASPASDIYLYIDQTGVTGSAINKNGATIGVPMAGSTTTLHLKPGDYFSETYTVGTPSAKWEP